MVTGGRFDLVLLSLGGVQRFIAESRSTVDVAGASKIVQHLAKLAARAVEKRLISSPAPCGLIFPVASSTRSVTNKIVFLAEEGAGRALARAAAKEVGDAWRNRLARVFNGRELPDTPGMPELAWVSVTGLVADGAYEELWIAAQREMVGRRRARVFEPVVIPQRKLCAQSAGLVAVAAPRGSRLHERNEALSAAGWVKREAGRAAFPSTVSIASSVFRSRLLRRAEAAPDVAAELRGPVGELAAVVERLNLPSDRAVLRGVPIPAGLEPLAGGLGAWVIAQGWDVAGFAREYGITLDERVVRDGHRAASELAAIAQKAGIPPLSPYFAIVVQDLDRLGRALGCLDLNRQRQVSHQLSELATRQAGLFDDQHPLAELVYAGGDDLLAFCPAVAALPLAAAIRHEVRSVARTDPLATAGPDKAAVTASTGVVFAHMSSPLREALLSARMAIRAAKSEMSAGGRSRDALAVVVRRRGGQRARMVQPWWPRAALDNASATELLTRIRPDPAVGALSAALGSELERDEAMLRELVGDQKLLRAELTRVVMRHGGAPEAGDALCVLGLSERSAKGEFAPVPAALVAQFLTREAR